MGEPWLTASATERVLECAASAVLPQTASTSKYSKSGIHHHSAIERVILEGGNTLIVDGKHLSLELPPKCEPEIAYSYNAISGEARRLGRIGSRSNYPAALEGDLFGTADIEGISELDFGSGVKQACVDLGDWKTSYEAPSPDCAQMRTLAFVAARAHGFDYARTRISHLRDGELKHSSWHLWTASDFVQTEAALRGAYGAVTALRGKGQISLSDVRFGPHCHFCPAYLSCPYPKSLLQSAEVGGGDKGGVLTNADAVQAYNRWQSLRTLAGRMEDMVKAYAVIQPLNLGNGYMYGKTSEEGNFRRFKQWKGED